ncbi:hypothetical protein M422DRAFT_158653 [Sphaerobolus stellatus SS14]|nr:hypothetical protein M422DRAFT_158653 [Sphaerobolus stellatus SS14]
MDPSIDHSDEKRLHRTRTKSSASRHVPFDHFLARSESRDSIEYSHHDLHDVHPHVRPILESNQEIKPESSRPNSSVNDTLVEGDFQFDKFLQERYDKAMDEGINFRQTGVTFKNLRVTGLGATHKHQETIFSALNPLNIIHFAQKLRHPPVKDILSGFNGSIRPGEMLLVLGKPGSGCTSFLKVLANQREGFHSIGGEISYDGINPQYMFKHYRGDLGYSPEDDIHFPSLTVRETLTVAAACRTPRARSEGLTRKEFIDRVVNTLGTILGLTHTMDTPVGDENIRGVSGGEKKRVSIAEMLSTHVKVACWDNSTRGLDASTALEFVRALRIATDIAKVTTIVSIYQASESIYELFDKVAVIDEGRLSYFGPADQARDYYINMGYEPANRQTTADFLVSVTDAPSRIVRKGYERRVPKTAAEFAQYFEKSDIGQQNLTEVKSQLDSARHIEKVEQYKVSARAERAKHMPPGSPYTISLLMQMRILITRRIEIIRGDFLTQGILLFNFIAQALIMGSVFLNLPKETSAFYSRGGTIFFAVLFGALSTLAEIPALYQQRPIVARHQKAALYHPYLDALALTLVDIPITVVIQSIFSIILYFMTGLQREAGKFFIFLLFVIFVSLTMKAFYRGLAASFPTQNGAQALAGIATLVLVIYTGFTIPRPSMIGALRWLTYINPLRYGFESLIANEFHGLEGSCSSLVPAGPGYENVPLENRVCTTLGAVAGSAKVGGDRFIQLNYGYSYSHVWMNFGITIVFWVGFLVWYLSMTEVAGSHSAGGGSELVFKQGAQIPEHITNYDEESSPEARAVSNLDGGTDPATAAAAQGALPKSKGTFSWHKLNYDVQLPSGETRRLLDDVSGYVAPGKLTALMGESGAGKTTLLNALAERLRTGVITGDRLVNGLPLPADFAAQTGYCQQMDIHLETATVREALQFSAMLRQPASVPKKEKYEYVEEVIKMCEMEAYADAVVGEVGQGLNVEQRKRLTIGVELAAKPELLLFLDEPTSGLSSQSAWAIVQFLRSLADRGQAILCTIHQPSAELFQAFDRMLLLRKGGQTCYFGDVGTNATELIQYFEANGGRKCESWENPAEYMLDVIGAGATAHSTVDWRKVWQQSPQKQQMEVELQAILAKGKEGPVITNDGPIHEHAASIGLQFKELTKRAAVNYIRSPSYLLSRAVVNIASGLLIGFTFFKAKNTIQGAQNHMFAIFLGIILTVPQSNMMQVQFLRFRQIYETRERSSKMYQWFPMLTANFLVELPLGIISNTLYFVCWYWTVGFPSDARTAGFMYFTHAIVLPFYYTTLSFAVGWVSHNAEVASLFYSFLFSFIMTFNGVLQPYSQLVNFWHWMYRLSPLTYFIEMQLSNGFGHMNIECSETELVQLTPPSGQTCNEYMGPFIKLHGGYLQNGSASSDCHYCSVSSSDQYLGSLNIFYDHRWRDFGFLWAYVIFNFAFIYIFYYFFRVRTVNPITAIINRIKNAKKN